MSNKREEKTDASVTKLEPPSRNNYKDLIKRIPAPSTPLEYARYELRTEALWRKYSLTYKLKENIALSISVVDGRKKTNVITLFKGGVTQCTCSGFLKHEINFCEHIAALQNTIELGTDKEWIVGFKAAAGLLRFANVTYYDSYQKDIKTKIQPQAIANCKTELAVSVETLKQKQELEKNNDNQETKEIVSNLNSGLKLFDYQEKIFAGMLMAKRAICSMVMGSGKTLTSIACLKWLVENKKENLSCLIVCPKSLKNQWKQEIKRAAGIDAVTIDSAKDVKNSLTFQVKILTYNLFSRIVDDLLKETNNQFDFVIFDEIQFIRNSETNVWKAANKIKTEYFIGLSGTVIENRLDDLYSVMEIVEPNKLGPKWRFSQNFQELVAVTRNGCVFRGLKNETTLREIIKDRVFGFDNLTLPEIEIKTTVTTMSKQQLNEHDKYMEEAKKLQAKALTSGLSFIEKSMLQAFLLKARQSCNALELITKKQDSEVPKKVLVALELVKQLKEQNKKVVIFTQWLEFMSIITREFDKNNIGYVKYTGVENEQKRKQNLLQFQESNDITVFLATDSGGVGLDGLQHVCCNVIHMEPPWNPAKVDQRNARVHRIGQKKPVVVTTLFCEKSIEENIMISLENKREIRETVFAV